MTDRQHPAFWDEKWAQDSGPRWSEPMIEKAAEIFNALPGGRVDEYGFGTPRLPAKLRTCKWRGFDFSGVAVHKAQKAGFSAGVRRCSEAERLRRSYVCAIATLPNLTTEERDVFLERVHKAPHAVFGVMKKGPEYGSAEKFKGVLSKFWPYVEVFEVPGERAGLVAHCTMEQPKKEPLLTVGTSTLLDFPGVLYTLASWQTHHGNFGGDVEFVVVDNHPAPTTRLKGCEECNRIKVNGPTCETCANNLASMKIIAEGEGARYIRWDDKQGTYPGKNQLKVEALGKWVLTMDSHVFLTVGALEECVDLIKRDPECLDFFHFPCLLRSYEPTHPGRPAAMDYRKIQWIYHGDKAKRGGVYGWTGEAKKAGEPYPIAAMITSCYLLNRAGWFSAKGYDPILGNYGGWEGPLQLKYWLLGREVRSIRHKFRKLDGSHPHDFLHHYHVFNNKNTKQIGNATGRIHTGRTKMRNFAASSAVIGGEWWVRRHCELKGWNFDSGPIQEGFKAGMELRPWMIENLAKPEWEDIRVFFKWMRDEAKVPGALESW